MLRFAQHDTNKDRSRRACPEPSVVEGSPSNAPSAHSGRFYFVQSLGGSCLGKLGMTRPREASEIETKTAIRKMKKQQNPADWAGFAAYAHLKS
jgi:hypothetical protein